MRLYRFGVGNAGFSFSICDTGLCILLRSNKCISVLYYAIPGIERVCGIKGIVIERCDSFTQQLAGKAWVRSREAVVFAAYNTYAIVIIGEVISHTRFGAHYQVL